MEQVWCTASAALSGAAAAFRGQWLLERYDCLYQIVTNEIEILQIRNEIQQKVRERVDKKSKGVHSA